jgi:hypothetical protein
VGQPLSAAEHAALARIPVVWGPQGVVGNDASTNADHDDDDDDANGGGDGDDGFTDTSLVPQLGRSWRRSCKAYANYGVSSAAAESVRATGA